MRDVGGDGHRYCPLYCEENVWQLCDDPTVPAGPRAAVFISNRSRQVAVAYQRASPIPEAPIVWDYHVVMALRRASAWEIWDLDSTLGLGVDLETWIDRVFGGREGFGVPHDPTFRVIEAGLYRETLSTDRSHMPEGPRPPWPRIGTGASNLMGMVAMEGTAVGDVVAAQGLAAALDRAVKQTDCA